MAATELLTLTIAELAPQIQARQISPVELTEAALAQAERLQPSLGSFITILHDAARQQAREQEAALMRGEYYGPLHGIPIGIKDNIATAGIRTTVGSKVLAQHVPAEDAEVVRRCKAAGAIIVGKENLEEFAAGPTSNNPITVRCTTPGSWTVCQAGRAVAVGPMSRPVSPTPRSAPTWVALCVCQARSAVWWASSRRSDG